jgi:hypothetical protein
MKRTVTGKSELVTGDSTPENASRVAALVKASGVKAPRKVQIEFVHLVVNRDGSEAESFVALGRRRKGRMVLTARSVKLKAGRLGRE